MLRQYFRYVSDGMAARFRKANGTQALTKHIFWRDTLIIQRPVLLCISYFNDQ
jgi:hypothetical protein